MISDEEMPLPLSALEGPVGALFCDLDGTLTTGGRLESATLAAIEALDAAGVPLILVTGRPGGWAHALQLSLPFRAAIAENGGVTYVRDGSRVRKHLALDPRALGAWRQRALQLATELMDRVPGARLSTDTAYREVDVAIDWHEEASLEPAAADALVAGIRAAGFTAFRSSVHVHIAPSSHDKLSASRALVADLLGGAPDRLEPYLFVGDSLNDEPMFAGFPRSIGVANVLAVWDQLAHRPAFVTAAAEGAGFRELAARILELVGGQVDRR